MSACVVWIDSENAKIFKLSPDGTIKNHIHSHTTHPIGRKHDAHKHNSEEHFFHEVAQSIGQVEELLVFGAGPAKNHFKNHLEKHHHLISKHLVGVEPLDHLSDNQILEASRRFFKKYNTFNSSI